VAPLGLTRFGTKEFDLAIASDFIEHLSEDEARITIEQLKRVAKTVVLFTPLGFHTTGPTARRPTRLSACLIAFQKSHTLRPKFRD
jgi:hypothetical protein